MKTGAGISQHMRTVTTIVTVRIKEVWFIRYEVSLRPGEQVLVENWRRDEPAHEDGDNHGNGED